MFFGHPTNSSWLWFAEFSASLRAKTKSGQMFLAISDPEIHQLRKFDMEELRMTIAWQTTKSHHVAFCPSPWSLHLELGHVLTEAAMDGGMCMKRGSISSLSDLSEAWVLYFSHTPLNNLKKNMTQWHLKTGVPKMLVLVSQLGPFPTTFCPKLMERGQGMKINWVIRIISLENWHKLEDTVRIRTRYTVIPHPSRINRNI